MARHRLCDLVIIVKESKKQVALIRIIDKEGKLRSLNSIIVKERQHEVSQYDHCQNEAFRGLYQYDHCQRKET